MLCLRFVVFVLCVGSKGSFFSFSMAAEERVMNINVGVLGHVDSGKSMPHMAKKKSDREKKSKEREREQETMTKKGRPEFGFS